MKRPLLATLVLASLILPFTLLAQVQNEGLANGIIAARQKNAARLQLYNWNSRSDLLQNGNLQDLRVNLVSLNPDGTTSKTLLNDQPGALPGGFFRKAIEEDQRKKLEKYVATLTSTVEQYTLPSAGAVINFLSTAQVQPMTAPDGKSTILQVSGANVVSPGDTFTMTVNGSSLLPLSLQVSTADSDGNPVTINATFASRYGVPNHVQYATILVPAKNVQINIHNYDYFLSE